MTESFWRYQLYTKNMKNRLFLILITAISLFSCSDNITDTENKATINGTISASVDNGGISVDSVMVILINANFKPDTIELNNEAAFIDTVYSNESGTFAFNNVAPGKYYVYPTKGSYQFTGDNISFDDVIEIANDDYVELSYTADILLTSGGFELKTKLVNCPKDTNKMYFSLSRKTWFLFIPYWIKEDFGNLSKGSNNTYDYNCPFDKGFTAVFTTRSNTFKFKYTITLESGDKIKKSFSCSVPMTKTPDESSFEFDWETNKVTELK